MFRSIHILILFLLIGLVSCFKEENYPETPVITFTDFVMMGDAAKLIFEFTDGNGDIGLRDDENFPPYHNESYFYYNLYVEYWEKHPSGWEQGTSLEEEPIVFKYRIKPFTNLEKEKPLKGTIEVAIEPLFYNPFSAYNDTIKYRVTLIDRALNESNVLETPVIIR